MTFGDLRRAAWIPLLAIACGGSGPNGPAPAVPPAGGTTGPAGSAGSLPNVVPINVAGAGCPAGAYLNEPCVSATVCVPGTSTCKTVDGLLLDTGSVGLRVFSQALALPLPSVTVGGRPLAECVTYLDGSSQWGPVVRASVGLGGEPPVDVPIQVIDAAYATRPSACLNADPGPSAAGFNGILGVQVFEEDCGPGCAGAVSGIYFACGATCAGTAVPLASQLHNPVAALPGDGNGLVIRLPAVPGLGAAAADGELVLGIGTRANNVPPPAVQAYPLDASGEFRTTLGGAPQPAFVDTGSNGIFFAAPAGAGLAACPAPNAGWFCPSATTTVAATIAGATGSASTAVTFQIANFDALPSGVGASSKVGGPAPAGSGVDWGLPFHLGREVYLGLEGRSSALGVGPLVAY